MLDSKEHNSNFDDIHNITKDNNVECPTVMTNQISELTAELLLTPITHSQEQSPHHHMTSDNNDINNNNANYNHYNATAKTRFLLII